MRTYSKILNKFYDADDGNVVYVTNILQVQRYLKNGASEDLVDILFTDTRREHSLVFVFQKTQRIKELYKKWQAHELN